MTKLFWNVLRVSPVVAATILSANSVLANEVKEPTTSVAQLSSDKISQTTSVSQFRDVQPRDWAFQALQSLVERYNCISGYPDGTFRGNRTLNRFEFAASLNACLERVSELIASSTADAVKKEDLATLQRLQEEFSAELATLRGQVDALEARTSELEGNQFSTTTKLKGEAIFGLTQAFGKGVAGSTSNSIDSNSNFTFSDRVRLTLESSFAGKDKLQIRLNASNVFNSNNVGLTRNTTNQTVGGVPPETPNQFASRVAQNGGTNTNMARLGYDGPTSPPNSINIDKINYAFNPLPNLSVKIDAIGADLDDNFEQFNPDFKSSGSGSISRYGRFSPIYRGAGSGVGVNFKANEAVTIGAGYYARKDAAADPAVDKGFFEGPSTIFGQVAFKPTESVNVGLTYSHVYEIDTSGKSFGKLFGDTRGDNVANTANTKFGNTVEANNYGLQVNFKATPKISLGGWLGYTTVNSLGATAATTGDVFYWAGNVAFKDLLREGNTLGIIFGQPPKFTGGKQGSTTIAGETDTSFHLEGLYKIKVSDNILVTPGLLVILDPEHNKANPNILVGTIRTTFSF